MELENYLEQLNDVVFAYDERYIDIPINNPNKTYLYTTANLLNKAEYLDDLVGDAYDIEKFEDENRFDIDRCINYFSSFVTNWDDLLNYTIDLLEGEIPGTVFHRGPISKETL